jgi:hypothetical protein
MVKPRPERTGKSASFLEDFAPQPTHCRPAERPGAVPPSLPLPDASILSLTVVFSAMLSRSGEGMRKIKLPIHQTGVFGAQTGVSWQKLTKRIRIAVGIAIEIVAGRSGKPIATAIAMLMAIPIPSVFPPPLPPGY